MPNDYRSRLHCLTETLRSFGLVDRFGLSTLIRGSTRLSRVETLRRLRTKKALLPASVPPEFIADALVAALSSNRTANAADEATASLAAIPKGPLGASQYHRAIFLTLSEVFSPSLRQGKMEEKVDHGRKRIDIVYRNAATRGFFHELQAKHQIFCPLVFAECKNYSHDIGNPEFDQLTGRFHDKRGRFGILVCREIADEYRTLETCKDIMNSGHNYVIVLQDPDVIALANLKAYGEDEAIDDFMAHKLRNVLL